MSEPEEILEQVLSGELTRQEAIERRPDLKDTLTLLTDLADDLQALPRYKPDPEFRHRARMRLLQHIQESKRRRRWWEPVFEPIHGLPGWASRVSAVVIAGGGLTFGVSYASASALPDDRLYPVKRAVEQVQVAMATSDEAKAITYLDLADRRAAEIAATAPDLDEIRLDRLTNDYGAALLKVSAAVQTLPDPSAALLDKVQARVASQATELEARAVNSAGRPAVQDKLVQAEVVASNVVDRVSLVAEKKGKPGPRDVQLAVNPPAAATAAAASLPTPRASASAAASAAANPSPAPSSATQYANPGAAPAPPSSSAPSAGTTALDTLFDRLWNEVSAAAFMGQSMRTQLEVDVANAKQAARAGKSEAAIADMNAFVSQLQAAVTAHQATQYTANRLTAQAKAIISALQSPAPGGYGLRTLPPQR